MSQKVKFKFVAAYDLRHRQHLANTGSLAFYRVDHELYVTIFDAGAIENSGKCGKC